MMNIRDNGNRDFHDGGGPTRSRGGRPSQSAGERTRTTPITVAKTSIAKSSTSPAKAFDSCGNINSGAAAGIGIGCALIGAMITILVILLMLRKSKRRSLSQNFGNNGLPLSNRAARIRPLSAGVWVDKTPNVVAYPVRADSSGLALENILPQPVDTKHISNELSTLRSLIRNHLSNFYITGSLEPQVLTPMIDQVALSEVAKDSPFRPESWIELLASTRTRASAMRFILGWVIFRRIEPECEPAKTLLPPGLTACHRHMSNVQCREQDGEFLQSRWRMITGFLSRDQYVRRAFDESDDRAQNLRDTVRLIDGILGPLGIESLSEPRTDNLTEILKRAASIGFTLASQPSSWIFDWDSSNQGGRETPLVLFPSLIQQTDDLGQKPQTDPLEIGEKEFGHAILIQ